MMFNKKILALIEINCEHQGLNYLRKGAICVLSYFITYIIISYHVSTSILSYTITASIPDYTSESASFVSQCFPHAPINTGSLSLHATSSSKSGHLNLTWSHTCEYVALTPQKSWRYQTASIGQLMRSSIRSPNFSIWCCKLKPIFRGIYIC